VNGFLQLLLYRYFVRLNLETMVIRPFIADEHAQVSHVSSSIDTSNEFSLGKKRAPSESYARFCPPFFSENVYSHELQPIKLDRRVPNKPSEPRPHDVVPALKCACNHLAVQRNALPVP